eukprot:CAMPEP_0118921378 /NCGR_PEP_ID=MMETSP1169-20130426/685_1 /TAXON_ID=36882 /ORGANISM="Pyramimonas obovata, Strain CCMP722" /LENGTH=138 /DNA_ID=CAMNT_0006862091 /DNA_START=587 /DNA_END=1003 /DNA_ORIENTATION=-
MARQPAQDVRKAWVLQYIPPKHLRLPEYTYDNADESEEAPQVSASRGRQLSLQRKLLTHDMTKVMSNMSLSQMDEEENHNRDEPTAFQGNAGDIETACVNHQAPRPELLLPCAMSAIASNKSPMNSPFNGSLNDTNVL